ncbi:hypothetical protein G6F50_013291 [Rhizopus delemar]|uniref:Uncharacterized protein n=1 Tax=Rhizopus delemar TaxID=936053 RepID=A0A9P6YK29_9FUNG|nr:hypothetical protein G6F50_013291 [Rhizopus delemar]
MQGPIRSAEYADYIGCPQSVAQRERRVEIAARRRVQVVVGDGAQHLERRIAAADAVGGVLAVEDVVHADGAFDVARELVGQLRVEQHVGIQFLVELVGLVVVHARLAHILRRHVPQDGGGGAPGHAGVGQPLRGQRHGLAGQVHAGVGAGAELRFHPGHVCIQRHAAGNGGAAFQFDALAAGRVQVGVGAGARATHAVGQRVVLDLVGQVIAEVRQAGAARCRLPRHPDFLVGGRLRGQRVLHRQQFVGVGQAEAAADLAVHAEAGGQVLAHAQVPGGQVVAAVGRGARPAQHVQVVGRILAAHAGRHIGGVGGADLAFGEGPVLVLARLPLGRLEVVVGVLVGGGLGFLRVSAEDEAVAAVDRQAIAHAGDVLFQLLVAQGVAETVE